MLLNWSKIEKPPIKYTFPDSWRLPLHDRYAQMSIQSTVSKKKLEEMVECCYTSTSSVTTWRSVVSLQCHICRLSKLAREKTCTTYKSHLPVHHKGGKKIGCHAAFSEDGGSFLILPLFCESSIGTSTWLNLFTHLQIWCPIAKYVQQCRHFCWCHNKLDKLWIINMNSFSE